MAYALMLGLACGNASRQVVAASATAVIRTMRDATGKECIDLNEKIKAEVEIAAGPALGIGALCRLLKDNGYSDLAGMVSCTNDRRKQQAHPPCDLGRRVAAALAKIGLESAVAKQDSQETQPWQGDNDVESDACCLALQELNTMRDKCMLDVQAQVSDMVNRHRDALAERQLHIDEKFEQLEGIAKKVAQQQMQQHKLQEAQQIQTLSDKLDSHIAKKVKIGDTEIVEISEELDAEGEDPDAEDEELQELYDDPDYQEFLRSGGIHEERDDEDLEGFE